MEVESAVAESVRVTKDGMKYDAACKRVLSNKVILAHIMKACVSEYRDCEIHEIVEKYIEGQPQVGEVPVSPDETNAPRIHGICNEDTSLTEGRVTYDIRFFAVAPVSGELVRLIINVEAQGRQRTSYPIVKRGVYYGSRMISAQYGTEFVHSEYEKIKKVVSIWICDSPPNDRRNSITRYCLEEKNLVGNEKEERKNYDLLEVIVVRIGGGPSEGVVELLNTLFHSKETALERSRILEGKFGIPMTEKLETEVSEMCNLSQGLLEEGREEGLAKGLEKGLTEGLEKGLVKGRAEETEHGMQILIQTMLEVPFSRMRIEEKLMASYGLTAEAAAEKVGKYMAE